MKERVLPAYRTALFSISNARLVFSRFISRLAGLSNLQLSWNHMQTLRLMVMQSAAAVAMQSPAFLTPH